MFCYTLPPQKDELVTTKERSKRQEANVEGELFRFFFYCCIGQSRFAPFHNEHTAHKKQASFSRDTSIIPVFEFVELWLDFKLM